MGQWQKRQRFLKYRREVGGTLLLLPLQNAKERKFELLPHHATEKSLCQHTALSISKNK